jgi:hypothetical protein
MVLLDAGIHAPYRTQTGNGADVYAREKNTHYARELLTVAASTGLIKMSMGHQPISPGGVAASSSTPAVNDMNAIYSAFCHSLGSLALLG